VYFRAIHSGGWAKDLFFEALGPRTLRRAFEGHEIRDVLDVMDEKGILLRTN
jgi:hypothetical protein